jgi:signal peptidase II
MFYFPVINGTLPLWFPFWGGNEFIFFRPVFNIADSSITIGIFIILLFYRDHFDTPNQETSNQEPGESEVIPVVETELTSEEINDEQNI